MDIAVSEGWLFLYGAQTWNERCWEFVRGDARGGAGGDRAGGVCAARICAVDRDGRVGRAAGGDGGGSVSKYGDARRVSHVGGDDELWRAGVGDGSEWVSVRSVDPESGKKWPAMPGAFRELAERAAAEAGFREFRPDACLINRYEPEAKLSLHQDKDERDFTQPIVSVSLRIPAVFLFGGFARGDKTQRVPLEHGDVVVWGGPARLRYHGVMALKEDEHPLLGRMRVNLTFRTAG